MTLSTGERLFWESTDLARGVVARVVEVLLPQGVFLFSTDPMLTASECLSCSRPMLIASECLSPHTPRPCPAVAVWDPILAALFAIACAAFFRVSTTATGALVVSPLEKMLSALVEAAAVLDAKGRVAKRAAEERLMVGDAVKRILAHMVISSGPTLRLTNSSSDDSGSDSPSPRKGPQTAVQGSILAPSPQQKGSILASSPQHKGSILLGSATGSAAPLRLSAPSDPSAKANGAPNSLAWMRESTPSGVEKSPPSMRFTPSVLNKLGSPAWNPRTFRDSELIPACHLIYIKTRIPDRVCPKERFVAFAERALERHPEMGFHNRR